MRFSRIQKKFFAACLVIFMFVGEVGNLPTSYALAKQTNGEQIVENAVNSNIPAPKTEESDVVPTVEEENLPIVSVLANQTDGEQSIENATNSNVPVLKTEESIVVPAGEDESEGEDQGEEALTKDTKISAKVFSNTSGDENGETIEPPSFGVTEEKFTKPFDLTFTNIPKGCNVYYYINDYSQNLETLYDPQNPAKINTECFVYAYCVADGENDTLTSKTVYQNYSPDIELATCSVSSPNNNIVESGGSITLTTEDSNLSVYYILASDRKGYSANYIKDKGNLYTGPIEVEGHENEKFYIYFITVNSNGVCSRVDIADFKIGTPPPPVPEFSPDKPDCGDIFNPIVWESPTTVTVTSKPDTSIYYRINEYGMKIEAGMEGVYTSGSNTMSLDVDHDMYVEVCAYDEEKKVYSSKLGRAYVIKEPKILTVNQSDNISIEGKIFDKHDEEYFIDVKQAGTYKITVVRPELYWGSVYRLPVYLYDSNNNDVLVALDDPESQSRDTLNIERNLEVGTYKLVLAYDQSGYSYMRSYLLTIAKGMEPPQFSVPEGMYGKAFELTLSNSDPNCDIYYSLNYGEYIKYTAPITISENTRIEAYASSGGVNSDTVYAYYQVDTVPPVLDSYYRFTSSTNGYIDSSTVLTGQVPIRAINIYDYNSGINYVDYYLSVNGGAYNKIGSAPWGTDFVWDTTNVTESNKGSVSVRLLPIAYDKAGNASAAVSDLSDEYDAQYSPTFHINNTPCAPVESLTYNEGVGSIKLNWSREPELEAGDRILIYRAETEEELSQNLIKDLYYNYEYSDYFFTKDSISASYYYEVSVRDKRGVESTMEIIGPVSPLEDVKGPEISVAGVEENGYKNSGSIFIYSSDETAVSSMSAKITASDGTEIIPSGSPWMFEPYRGGNYSGRISEDEFAALSDGAYTLIATAADFCDNSSSLTLHFIKDSIAPQAPVVTASSIPGQIALRWTASEDEDVIGYNILYSETEDGSFNSLNYDLLTECSFTYPPYYGGYLEPGEAYWFKVQAVDRAGNISETEPVKGIAGKYNPKIRLINENPRLGDNIQIAFSGFKRYEYVNFYLDRNEEPFTYSYSYDASKEEIVSMGENLSLIGVHTIRAVGADSGAVAQIRFTISDLASSVILTPSIVTAKSSFNVRLDGFPMGKPIYFYIDPVDSSTSDVPYTYLYADDNYNSVNLYLSSFGNPPPGVYVFRAVEPESGLTALSTLTVTEPEVSLRCEQEKPSAGEYVVFHATGFDSDKVDLYINGELVGSVDRPYYQTEHSFYVFIPEVYKDVEAVLATAVQTSTGKEASIKVPLKKDSANISISKENVGFESFTIKGSGFGNSEEVKLYVDGVEKSSATHYDNSVSFTYRFGYDTEPGSHGIELRGEKSGITAIGSIVFTDSVQTLILSDKPTLDKPLTLYAGGFSSGETVSFSINDVIIGNGYADANGDASYTVDSLEYSPANGSYTFTAKGENSNRVAFYGISAESGGDLSLSYEGNIRSGSTVNITVTGLKSGESADVYVKNREKATIVADSSGRAVAQFVVPKGYTGNIPVTVHGKASQKWGTVSVPATGFNPTVTITPEVAAVGSVITAEVAGYMPGATLHLKFDDYNSANDAVVSQSGTASLNYTIPATVTEGEHTVSVYDSVTGTLIQRLVNVASSSLTLIYPKTALPGETITLGASGLYSGEVLRVSVNGTSVGGNLKETDGKATTTYTLPHNAAFGNYKVVFAFEKMAVTQMAGISVTAPAASVQAVMDEKNATITIHAQNFMPKEPLSVYFDNREINNSLKSYTTGEDGTFDALYTLPVTTFAGDHKVDLLGRSSYRRASTIVNVKETGPIISISGDVYEGKAGDTLGFVGVNFTPLRLYDLYFESELLYKDANVDENGEIAGTFTIPDGFADGRYRLIANDKSSGKTAICYIRIDTTPPGAPSLSLFARKQSVVLSWDAPADEDVALYSVYCKPEDGEGYIKLAELDSATTTWTHDMRNNDCPIIVGKRYEYFVRATDRLGNEGEGSDVRSAVLADGTDAPVITGAYANTGSSIRINNEYLYTIKGNENVFYVSVSDDQQISKIEIAAAPENREFLLVGSTVPSYSNNNGGNSEYRAELTIDTTLFSDGVHTFRFTALDSSGNTGSIERRYYIDNTPPPSVTGLKVVGTSNSVFVSWSWTADATGEVPERYNVYYSKDKNFETYNYTSVYTYEGTKSYTIHSLEPDTLYYIRVTALDIAGNESTWAEGNATPILDEEKPVITQITPDEQRLGKNADFRIEATDNSGINWNSVRAEINAGADGLFIPFGSYSYGAVRAENLNYNGTYKIRFYISDLAGNESDAYEITREIDTFVTTVTGLTASPAAGGIRLTWNRCPDKDLSYYYVYRSEGGEFELQSYVSPLKTTLGDTVTWIDYSTNDGITYTYKIVAVDDVYNKSSIDDTTSAESQKGSYDTTVTLNPSTDVKPGTIIHISAEGFRGGESVSGYIDNIDENIFWASADDYGNVSVDWSYVKATEAGSHTIKLKGEYSLAEASASFTCEPVKLPAPPALESTPGIMEINLSWEGVDNASYYRVYRAEGTSDEKLLADRVYGHSYKDRNLSMTGDVGNIYTYTIAAVDRYGNEGQHSETTVNRPESDLTDPEIGVFTFQRTGSVLRLVAEVSDDLRLSKVIFKYKPAEASDSSYIVIAETTINGSQKKATVNSTFDTSALPDGSYTLLAQAIDGGGRVSVPVTKTMTISSEAPKAPEELSAEAGQMRITLSWKEPTVQNVKIARYNIYRKSGESGYVYLSSTTLTSFTDLEVKSNETYIYQVTCVSEAETEGPAVSLSDRISPQTDTISPEITGFIIPDGTRLAGSISVAVAVTDNVGVDHVDFFLTSGAKEAKIGSSATGAIMVNTAEYIKEGILSFKAKAYDEAGNFSEASVSYQIDNAAPAAPVLSVSSGELSVTLKWTMTTVPRDILKYNVYEYIADGDKYRLIGETASSVFVYNTKLGASYCVSAVDDLGNESFYSNIESCVPGVDTTAPTINGFNSNDVVKSEASLTINAYDNTAVASYLIEYRPLTTDDITGAVVPKEGENAPWYVLSTGSWDELETEDTISDIKLFSWDTLAVIGTEDGPKAKFPDGLYAFMLTLTDTAGNKATSEIRLNVGNDPPTAPEGFRVDSGEWKLIVSWKPAPGNDASAYALYRKVNDGDYELLAYTTSNVYVDQGLNPVNQYFYKVAMENDLGKLGPTTEDYSEGILPPGVKTRPEAETSLPVIVAMSPAQGSRFNAGLNIELQIADNVSLSTVELWKAYIGTSSASQIPEDAVYESFAEIDASDLKRELVNTSDKDILGTELFVVKKTVDTSAWEQGNYAIKAVVRNMGSEPSVQVKTYFKDSTPPSQPILTVSDPHSGGTVNLSWTGSGADVAYYKVLRTEDYKAGAEDCALIATPLSPVYTDMGLTDGTAYYYYIVTVDNAGNTSKPSDRQSITPTAVSDLGVYSVYASPATLASGRTNTIRASLRNNGNAAADGVVKFYYGDLEIGSTTIALSANTGGEVSINWDSPADLPERVDIQAVVTTVQDTDATDENNSFTASDIKVNIPPVAKIVLPAPSDEGNYDSGAPLSFSASGSIDTDGSIVQYRWDFGNGKKGDYATSSVTYAMPGRYTVSLTVTDDFGAKTETSQVITVGDRRPDLFVESVRWSPSDPKEGDMVTITATIGNKGLGDATLGFLTGFYIDNRYMGYSKTDVGENGVSLACGKTTEVSFSYQSSAGTHIVKVVANDILNNLSETSKTNNVKSEVLSSQQLSFADIAVTNIYWDPKGTVFDTQAPFVYRADISNIGTAEASNFSVSLYIDDEFSGRQTVPVLAPGTSTTLSFNAVPQVGIHKVEVKADDLNPCLIEADIENNTYSIVTDEFSVYYPELEITEVTWKPTETTLTDGTSLLFTAKLTNLSTVSVTDSFRVSFTMDGRIFRTVTVEGIGAGEVKEVQAKWAAVSGNHQLGIIVDPQHSVIDPETVIRKDINLPRLSIIYPNVCVSNVSYSPIKVEAGKPVSFLVYITNNNVASAFKRFNVGLYVDGKAVGGASVDGIRGFSTVPVVISWTPKVGGAHDVKIVADSYGELKMDAPSEGTSRTWSSVINVSEALVMTTHPNEKDQDEDFLAVLYSTSEEKITLTADLRHSSNLGIPVTPEDDGEVYYSISLNGEIAGNRSGKMRYDYAEGIYTIDVPLGNDLATGTYQLDFVGRSGADTVFAPTTNIKIVREGNVTVETNKESYQLGESIHVSGTFRYSDGTPVAGERVVLDYRLLPALKEPIQGVDANGKEVLMSYQAEEIVFVETDENGAYSSIFTPFTGEAGEWSINAFGYEKMMGTGASTSVQVWGLVSAPSSLKLVATENSQFSKEITVRNPSPKNNEGAPLTGLSATLVQKSGHGVTATLDTASMARTLAQGASASVQLNVSASL